MSSFEFYKLFKQKNEYNKISNDSKNIIEQKSLLKKNAKPKQSSFVKWLTAEKNQKVHHKLS